MATATYRIGPSDFFLGGDLKADADTLNDQVETLDHIVEGNESLSVAFVDQWVHFQGQWGAFYYQTFGGYFDTFLSGFNNSNRDQLISYENQFARFAERATAEGAPELPNVVAPSTGTADTLGDHLKKQGVPSLPAITTTLVVIVVVALVAVVVLK